MRSHTSALISKTFHSSLPIFRSCDRSSSLCALLARVSLDSGTLHGLKSYTYIKVRVGSGARRHGFWLRRKTSHVNSMDEGSFDISSLHDWADTDGPVEYAFSSSEGEDSDGEMLLQPITDVDLPTRKEHFHPTDDSITLAAHRFVTLGRAQKKRKSIYGILNNFGILAFLTAIFSLVDWCAWRIVRLPLAPFYLIRPFAISIAMVCFVGYICVPLLRSLKLQSIIRKGPARHFYKSGTPTMGGLYFIPIGIIVAEVIVGFSSIEVSGAAAVTIAFAAIGLVDDLLSLKNNNNGLSAKMRILFEENAGSNASSTWSSVPRKFLSIFNFILLCFNGEWSKFDRWS